MSAVYKLADQITCHAWNGDRSMLAICPNSNEIWIFTGCNNKDPKSWKKAWVLTDHDMTVCGIDWSASSNKIVSCSHDRNAFVWSFSQQENTWKPSLVLLRINRAAMAVKWSPDGKKFAVASGSKCVPVCYYEAANDWWPGKMIKKHKSTVLDIAWHPNSQWLATTSSDFKCRIFSAYIADLDQTAPSPSPFQKLLPFGELLAEFDEAKGWVEAVGWSPSGNRLAFAGHDSSLTVIEFNKSGGPPSSQTVRFTFLPLEKIMFTDDNTIVGGGHDHNIALFQAQSGGRWSFVKFIDTKPEATSAAVKSSGFSAARNMFESKVSRGQSDSQASGSSKNTWTKHQNSITDLQPYKMTGSSVQEFTSSGLDGRVVAWTAPSITTGVAGMRI